MATPNPDGQIESHFALSRLIWRPTHPSRTALDAFRRTINRKHSLDLSTFLNFTCDLPTNLLYCDAEDYHDLHRYSVEDYTFWQDLWEYVGMVYSVPPAEVESSRPTLCSSYLSHCLPDTERRAYEGTSYMVSRREAELCREPIATQ